MAGTKNLKKTVATKNNAARKTAKTKVWEDVYDEKRFFVNDGTVLKNLAELPDALKNMSLKTFAHHVNKEKNDFANWVHGVMGEEVLAKQMRVTRSRTELMRTIKAKI